MKPGDLVRVLHTNSKHGGKTGIILAVRERSSPYYEGAPPFILDVLIDGEIRRNASCRWFEVVGVQE
jgi:hypothetical protein